MGARERRNEDSVCRSALGGGFSVGLAICRWKSVEFVLATIIIGELVGLSWRYARGSYKLRVRQICGIYIHHAK